MRTNILLSDLLSKKLGNKITTTIPFLNTKKTTSVNIKPKAEPGKPPKVNVDPIPEPSDASYTYSSNSFKPYIEFNDGDTFPTNIVCKKGVKGCAIYSGRKNMGYTNEYPAIDDAWFMHENTLKHGGIDVLEKDLQLGDYVELYDSKRPKAFNRKKDFVPKKGFTPSKAQHIGIVVGFNKDGIPVIEHSWRGQTEAKRQLLTDFDGSHKDPKKNNYIPTAFYRSAAAVKNPNLIRDRYMNDLKNKSVSELNSLDVNNIYKYDVEYYNSLVDNGYIYTKNGDADFNGANIPEVTIKPDSVLIDAKKFGGNIPKVDNEDKWLEYLENNYGDELLDEVIIKPEKEDDDVLIRRRDLFTNKRRADNFFNDLDYEDFDEYGVDKEEFKKIANSTYGIYNRESDWGSHIENNETVRSIGKSIFSLFRKEDDLSMGDFHIKYDIHSESIKDFVKNKNKLHNFKKSKKAALKINIDNYKYLKKTYPVQMSKLTPKQLNIILGYAYTQGNEGFNEKNFNKFIAFQGDDDNGSKFNPPTSKSYQDFRFEIDDLK